MWTDAAAGKKVILKSSDGETFEVDEVVALESQTIKHMIEDDCADSAIPLPNVSGKILSKVIEYCKKHVEAPKAEDRVSSGAVDEDLKQWDAEFVRVDLNTLFHFISAANYLNIESLLDLTCQAVADMIKGKTPEEIRKTFNIKSEDYLNIKSLLDRTCQTVAEMFKGTTPEEITKTFNIKDAEFVKVDQNTLSDLILSADYLNIKSLLDLTCQAFADMIKGKTPEEIKKTFNIKNDFTPEEEEEVRRENQWAFE